MTAVLGISAFFHDSAAALLVDGEIVAAAQEERFSREKHDSQFPSRAIAYCLDEAGLTAGELDFAAFYEDPFEKFDRLMETYRAFAPEGFDSFERAVPGWATSKLSLADRIRRELGSGFRGELFIADHHDSHAASAFFPSPYEEAAVLTLDAVGEWATSGMGQGVGNRVELSREQRFPHSLGMLYSAFTYYTGFRVNSGEYKLMGLAPYGRPTYRDVILEEVVSLGEDGSLWLDMSYFNYCQGLTMTSEKFHRLFGGPPRQPETELTQKEMDLAASVQQVCEEAVLRSGVHAHETTGKDRLVMAGGVALNCVANGRLLREGPFEDVWVQPAAGDAGGALGCAYLVWHHHLGEPRRVSPRDSQKGSLLGPSFSSESVQLFLDSRGARYERLGEEELVERVARHLDEGQVIGFYRGRMEYGPRALGCRSIIGDARSEEMQRTMNLKIKFRESFRPFAPCVLRDHVHEIFETRPEEDWPYMLFVAHVRPELRLHDDGNSGDPDSSDLRERIARARSEVPAVTHVDYSSRIQTVDEERHGTFYRVMERFYRMTGCPVIVNTSFNIRGEPIVCTPHDAFRCFMATNMDCLVLEDCILLKEDQPEGLHLDSKAYRSQFDLD